MLLSDYNGDIVKLDLKRGELSLEEAKGYRNAILKVAGI